MDATVPPAADLRDHPYATTSYETPASFTPPAGPATRPRPSRADTVARKVLRIREPDENQEIHNLFSSSIALSGTRCLLSYIVLPIFSPWLGTVPVIGPAIGIPVGLLALVFDVRAMRRFFESGHRWRWAAAGLYVVVMMMVAALVARDVAHLT